MQQGEKELLNLDIGSYVFIAEIKWNGGGGDSSEGEETNSSWSFPSWQKEHLPQVQLDEISLGLSFRFCR